jgi:hypothetical protein
MGNRKPSYFKPRPLTEEEMALVRHIVESADDKLPHYSAEELLAPSLPPCEPSEADSRKKRAKT